MGVTAGPKTNMHERGRSRDGAQSDGFPSSERPEVKKNGHVGNSY